jgi:hypothetical protein
VDRPCLRGARSTTPNGSLRGAAPRMLGYRIPADHEQRLVDLGLAEKLSGGMALTHLGRIGARAPAETAVASARAVAGRLQGLEDELSKLLERHRLLDGGEYLQPGNIGAIQGISVARHQDDLRVV